MIRRIVTATAVLSALGVCHANAAPPVPMPSAYSWTGYYIGISGGGIWSNGTVNPMVSGTPGPNASQIQSAVAAASFHSDKASGLLGVQLGYNWQSDRWLAGLEADFSGAAIDQSGAVVTIATAGRAAHTITSTLNKELDEIGTVRGRIGFLATDQLLIYGTGGLAYGRTPTSYDVSTPNGGGVGALPFNVMANGPDWRVGWAAGGGFEYLVWNGWTAKVEYLHYDLGSDTLTVTNTIPVSNFTATVRPTFSGDLVRVGLNHKF